MTTKKWYQSRTIVLAILTGISGIVLAFEAEFPEVGLILVFKSIIDVALRLVTSEEIE